MRPQAQQQLQRSFQRSAGWQRRKQQADQQLLAVQNVSVMHQLGDSLTQHTLTHRSLRFGWGFLLLAMLVIFSIGGIDFITGGPKKTPPNFSHIVNTGELTVFIVVVACIVGAFVLAFYLMATSPPDRYEWVYIYTEGLAYIEQKKQSMNIIRWDEIDAVRRTLEDNDDGSTYLVGYSIRCHDERFFKFSQQFTNIGGLARNVDQQVVQHHLPQMLAAYNAGQSVAFGDVTLSAAGISISQGRKRLFWNEVKHISFQGDSITINKRGKGLPTASLDISNRPNVCLLQAMLEQLRQAYQIW